MLANKIKYDQHSTKVASFIQKAKLPQLKHTKTIVFKNVKTNFPFTQIGVSASTLFFKQFDQELSNSYQKIEFWK